jgi:hypothetical protein
LLFWLKGIDAKTEFQINRTKSFKNFSFRRTIHLSLQTYYTKHLTSLFFVSIVKRGYLLLSNFLPHFGKKFKKMSKKTTKTQKIMLLMYLHHFQCRLKRIQILNVFLMCSTFSVSFSKSLIFLIDSTLILLFLKKI